MKPNQWTKARCESGACVEVQWRSACEGASCVQVATDGGHILVRDLKDPDGPVLSFTLDEWAAFTAGVRAGVFDV